LKVSIIISDDHGNNYHGECDLAASSKAAHKSVKSAAPPKSSAKTSVNLSIPIRAFVKQHAHDLSGPEKFALLVAYLTKGDSQKGVLIVEVEKQWNRMKPLLGGKFNLAYTTRAKDNGWVDSPKRGVYVVLPGWKSIFDA
jgi:hypothetical protein